MRARQKPSPPPGYNGQRTIAPAIVDSPYVRGTFDAVVRNVQESTLAFMHHNGNIDDAQLQAGTWFRKTYERMRMGSMAVDPSREPVDTSGISDPIPSRMLAASQELAAARAEVGRDGYRLVELICGQGWSVREASWKKTTREIEHSGWLFRLSLDRLAQWLGYST